MGYSHATILPTHVNGTRCYQVQRWRGYPLLHGFGTIGQPVERYLGGFPSTPRLIVPHTRQVHGTTVHCLDIPPYELLRADAFMVGAPHVVASVRTADCVPILLYDPARHVGAAVHAGWRGLAAGIIARTVEALCARYHVHTATLEAAIGPAIGQADYQVDATVIDTFRTHGHPVDEYLRRRQLDLPGLAADALQRTGIAAHHLAQLPYSTWQRPGDFASFRRGDVGRRQVSFLVLRACCG